MSPTDAVEFPYIVVSRLKTMLEANVDQVHMTDTDAPLDVYVFGRSLTPMDPSPSIGIFAQDWAPIDYEIDGSFSGEATLSRYTYGIDVLVKHSDVEEGSRVHGELSKAVRSLVMRNVAVRDALSGLSVASDRIERVSRWGVTTQAFVSGDVKGSMIYLSSMQMFVETELV